MSGPWAPLENTAHKHTMCLTHCRPKLQGTLFQKDLGSLLDKADRVSRLIEPLASAMQVRAHAAHVSNEELEVAKKAALLAKADLATSTVMEMTALAGELILWPSSTQHQGGRSVTLRVIGSFSCPGNCVPLGMPSSPVCHLLAI